MKTKIVCKKYIDLNECAYILKYQEKKMNLLLVDDFGEMEFRKKIHWKKYIAIISRKSNFKQWLHRWIERHICFTAVSMQIL